MTTFHQNLAHALCHKFNAKALTILTINGKKVFHEVRKQLKKKKKKQQKIEVVVPSTSSVASTSASEIPQNKADTITAAE